MGQVGRYTCKGISLISEDSEGSSLSSDAGMPSCSYTVELPRHTLNPYVGTLTAVPVPQEWGRVNYIQTGVDRSQQTRFDNHALFDESQDPHRVNTIVNNRTYNMHFEMSSAPEVIANDLIINYPSPPSGNACIEDSLA